MENSLIGLIAKAETLQKLVCKPHHLTHSNIIFLQTLQVQTIGDHNALGLNCKSCIDTACEIITFISRN